MQIKADKTKTTHETAMLSGKYSFSAFNQTIKAIAAKTARQSNPQNSHTARILLSNFFRVNSSIFLLSTSAFFHTLYSSIISEM